MVEVDRRGHLARGDRGVIGLVDAQAALDHVDRADEVGHEAVGRIFIEVGGRGHLLQAAPVHQRAAAGHGQRLVLIVGDHHERHADIVLDLGEFGTHRIAQLGVERGERLVEQEHLGPLDQRAGEGDALALPARELVGLAVAEFVELDQLERLFHPRLALVAGHAVDLQAIGDILRHGQVRKDRVGLEHHVDRAAVGRDVGHVDPVDQDAPLAGRFEPGEHAQQGRLAAARGAEQREELAPLDIEADIVDRDERAEALGDGLELDERLECLGHGHGHGRGRGSCAEI